MRCPDLADTWADLRRWLDQQRVLVLPPLTANLPLTRLDADTARSADGSDPERVVNRLRTLITHFDVRAIYVAEEHGGPEIGRPQQELAALTIRVLAGGVVHELTLLASWYDEFLKLSVEAEFVPAP
ncbi:MAG TPA: hypothetical protein VHW44_05955 [Pseudonocardiaceae bacterium]|jgi:hypothetical protein|nr:hypothetical protein [Pseudonocardiaceae bacterium]